MSRSFNIMPFFCNLTFITFHTRVTYLTKIDISSYPYIFNEAKKRWLLEVLFPVQIYQDKKFGSLVVSCLLLSHKKVYINLSILLLYLWMILCHGTLEFVYFLLSSCLLCLYTNALGLNLLGLKGEKVTEIRI